MWPPIVCTILVPTLRDARPKFIQRLVERARAANCAALMITLDLQIMGQRHKDEGNGLSAPPANLRNIINLMQNRLGALACWAQNGGNLAILLAMLKG